MKWLLLLSLISCSTQQTIEQVPSTDPEIVTETDARPVSPYTVKPCYCMKIFLPVCAEGVNYGNSCEAECKGHTKWTEGPCERPGK